MAYFANSDTGSLTNVSKLQIEYCHCKEKFQWEKESKFEKKDKK